MPRNIYILVQARFDYVHMIEVSRWRDAAGMCLSVSQNCLRKI